MRLKLLAMSGVSSALLSALRPFAAAMWRGLVATLGALPSNKRERPHLKKRKPFAVAGEKKGVKVKNRTSQGKLARN